MTLVEVKMGLLVENDFQLWFKQIGSGRNTEQKNEQRKSTSSGF